MRRFIVTVLTALPLTVWAQAPADLLGMRVQSSKDVSHFIFILNQKTYGRVEYTPQKNLLILEFANTQKSFAMEHLRLAHGDVATIKTLALPKNKLQFIFELKNRIKWRIQFVAKQKEEGVHLQLDMITDKSKEQIKSLPVANKGQLKKHFENDLLDTFHPHKQTRTIKSALTFVPFEFEEKKNNKRKIFTVVIDPGHGGKDAGATGASGILEKNVVLSIAKRLAREINLQTNMRAVLTRTGDYYVPLRTRLQQARKSNADLFIAIHADAYFDKKATGASIYALSQRGATTEAARWLAQQENYAELDGLDFAQLKDRSSMLRSVLIDLSQTATIRESLRLGSAMLDALDDISALHYSRVEQAPFVVLKSPDIPSVLVETAFITNPYEEKRLADGRYQQKIADALMRGVNRYIEKYHLR